MTNRETVRSEHRANNWAIVRKKALAWGSTQVGKDYGSLLDALDGKAGLSEQRRYEILVRGRYTHSVAGDSIGDDIYDLVEAVSARQREFM